MPRRSHLIAKCLLGLALLWQTSAMADALFGCCTDTQMCCVEVDMSGCAKCVATPFIDCDTAAPELHVTGSPLYIEQFKQVELRPVEVLRPPD